jgi:hypothetical protein
MNTKTFEVRDRGTFIPILAIRLEPSNEADRYLLARAGYGTTPEEQRAFILLARITGGEGSVQCDPYEWPGGARTIPEAHRWLINHFDEVESGAVIDVEFILGETTAPKVSEACAFPLP